MIHGMWRGLSTTAERSGGPAERSWRHEPEAAAAPVHVCRMLAAMTGRWLDQAIGTCKSCSCKRFCGAFIDAGAAGCIVAQTLPCSKPAATGLTGTKTARCSLT